MKLYRIYEKRFTRDEWGDEYDTSLPCAMHFYKEENAKRYCEENDGYTYREAYILIGDINDKY